MYWQFRTDSCTLMHQRCDQDFPAFILRSDQVGLWHPHIFKKYFVELRVSGDLYQRPHRDTWRFHIDNQTTNAAMLGRIGVSTNKQLDEVGTMRIAGPDFLAVDDKEISILNRTGLH